MVAPNLKAETMGLMDRRAALEAEMDAIIAALSASGGPGITGGLVDEEGFPRSDIDIPAVLAQRRKLAELRNDHKDITNKIEKNLEVLHSTKLSRNEQSILISSGTPASLHSGLSQNDPMEEDAITRLPFAIIDELTDGSPAAVDGLQLWDEIVKFGNVEAGITNELNCYAKKVAWKRTFGMPFPNLMNDGPWSSPTSMKERDGFVFVLVQTDSSCSIESNLIN
ncbi:hypothetical protein E2562_008298 [Oryza meyeriana var. granulata]|uniref:Nas2 N-terminal domain-containing protein n=1 Tax=Oryza meyeriana var. granulata TaxID=110450 RepID=A0A6G1DI84_9ORYZ|nr:hypothetical protein E2562_008298 [Oryza meyeriana var. granulata]